MPMVISRADAAAKPVWGLQKSVKSEKIVDSSVAVHDEGSTDPVFPI